MDLLGDLWREYPALIKPNGEPVSWRAMQYALAHSVRAHAREDLRHAEATGIVQAKPEDWKEWHRSMSKHAGG